MLQANGQMKAASLKLAPVRSYEDGLPIFFLTGEKFLYQTLFCITSLTRSTNQQFKFTIIDDGSLNIGLAQEKLPGAHIITSDQINKNLKEKLPSETYPVINRKRQVYAHLKKLTDIHTLEAPDWKLVLDSDMLFWNEPTQIIDWIKIPTDNLFMQDSHQSYGYSLELMKSLCGTDIPSKLNVGVTGIRSNSIDWRKIENWIIELENKEGGNYYLEQALVAMLTAGKSFNLLPSNHYIVYPSDNQIAHQEGILQHYVDLSKKDYFMHAWKQFIHEYQP